MAQTSTIDNLPANATASEMEQAIKAHLAKQTESAAPAPIVKEAIEQEKAANTVVEAPISAPENNSPVEETENEFDYKKAYDGLRGWNTKLSQQVSDLERRLDARQQEPKPAAQQTITQDQYLEWYQRDPVAAQTWLSQVSMQPVQQKVNYLESTINNVLANAKVAEFGSKHADFQDLRQDIFKEVALYPKEVQDNPEYYDRVLETAYYSVKGRRAVEQAEKAREQGRREATARAAAKANAVVEGASAPASEPILDMDKMSSKELFALMQAKGYAPKTP
jgi:hypothetical protein